MRYLLLISFLFAAQSGFAQNGDKQITVEDIWKDYTFKVKNVPGFNAMNDGKHYTALDADGKHQTIHVYDLATGNLEKTLFDNQEQMLGGLPLQVDEYLFSKNEQKMLLLTENENIYRRSILYRTYIYDIKTGSIQLLDYDKVLNPTFSPDGTKVAFAKKNNLYYKDLTSGQVIPVSKDGEKNRIINGNCDWVYEEEFSFTRAYEWSKEGNYLAYYRFDESLVPEFTISKYYSLYPELYTYKYPKAGERNSIVQIKVYDVKSKKAVTADAGTETDQYIPRIKWTQDDKGLCVYRLNRRQNKLDMLLTDAATGKSHNIYHEENKRYLMISDNIEFLPDGHSFVFNSERRGYNSLYKWNWRDEELTPLAEGDYDVDALVGVDVPRKLVYYTAAETSPMERKLYVVDLNGSNKKCLTKEKGMHEITPCDGFNFFIDRHSRLNKVPVYSLIDASGNVIKVLEDNQKLADKMKDYQLGSLHLVKVNGVSEKLNAWMLTPPNFDSNKKYPVLMFQYSGPGSQQVTDRFPISDYFWYQMLAEKGYIILCADGTGTGFRGEEFRKKTYLQLGKYESDDQIAIAKYIGTLPYVDSKRIGIWGWSYGAFMSATCMFKGGDLFKMGIAVAPVSNWRYYDNIYTERYMRLPQENEKGYDDNAPEKMVKGLTGKLLLVHGTGDDNVHFQNSIMMVDELIKADKEFDSEYYPNKAHGISGGNTRLHLYRRMTKFILENL